MVKIKDPQTKFHQNKDWNDNLYKEIARSCPIPQTKFHQNKDWNDLSSSGNSSSTDPQTKFHQNKDWNCENYPTARLIKLPQTKFHQNKDWNTWSTVRLYSFDSTPRRNSTRTRIETQLAFCRYSGAVFPPDEIPPEQGLKLEFRTAFRIMSSNPQTKFHQNKDWNKPWRLFFPRLYLPPDEIPPEQGLKLYSLFTPYAWTIVPQTKFHQNKDWNQMRPVPCRSASLPQTKFHQNKDWNTRQSTPNGIGSSSPRRNSTRTRIETKQC